MSDNRTQVNKLIILKAKSLYTRALHLQGEIQAFQEELEKKGLQFEALLIGDGALEMDITWNNAECVYKSLLERYEKANQSI